MSEMIIESVIDIEWVHIVPQCSRTVLSYAVDRTCFSVRRPRPAKRVKMPQLGKELCCGSYIGKKN